MLTVLIVAMLLQAPQPVQPLTESQVAEAIEMGRAGNVPIVEVGTWLGASTGDFHVFVEGPMARIAAEATAAFKQLRPFDLNNVTDDMRAPLYRVVARRDSSGHSHLGMAASAGSVKHIVLQVKGAKGLDGVLQPVAEHIGSSEAYFDRLPDTEFDVVLALSSGTQRYGVSPKDRLKIEAAAGIVRPPVLTAPVVARLAPPVPAVVAAPAPAAVALTRTAAAVPAHAPVAGVRLFVQGDGKHIADAVQELQAGLAAAGLTGTVVPRGEHYDYTIAFGEGDRGAASLMALDAQGNHVAVVVKGGFTEKGSAEGVARELAKKLAALAR